MGYPSLQACVLDLERHGHLIRIEQEVDAYLEAAAIHRRVYQAGGPALLFTRVKGCQFPMVSNLFGTMERVRFMFRATLETVQLLVRLKVDPGELTRKPWRFLKTLPMLWHMRPKWVRGGPVLAHETTVRRLPQLQSWPRDGGAFITLPQVYTEDADRPGWRHSNLGMYRIQLSGGEYQPDHEVGLHYQIHRGIGVHHAKALARGTPFRVSIWVGGPPAMTLAAVMPLPEGMPELAFAGALGGRRVRLVMGSAGQGDIATGRQGGRGTARQGDGKGLQSGQVLFDSLSPCLPVSLSSSFPVCADADFCITGTVDPVKQLPEGPFGDHLGYYSLAHPFPVLSVERVWHRDGAIWPFTVVGRPPQEDTFFGRIIHEITGPVIPTVIPGLHAVHAVDAAGVHPLLLAIGSERYVPYAERRRPQELLTIANAILGQGQLSLAKFLCIVAQEDDPALYIHDIAAFFRHLLERVDWQVDLHFQTRTTIDTLDYSGEGLNAGSKVVIAAVGPRRRTLPMSLPADCTLPDGFHSPRVCLPGVLAVQAPRYDPHSAERFCTALTPTHVVNQFPLIVLVDDSAFPAESLNNFLWVTFTRSNPAADVHGIGSFIDRKHWGCHGSLVIDARVKPHHAPPLEEDPEVHKRVDALAAPGGPLHGII
jgi:4-hydroxy-3-polyprenylbenzoate decarboxylase